MIPRSPFTEAMAGKLLFLGRNAGMKGIAVDHLDMLFFIRRVGKEYDLIADGKELSVLLGSVGMVFKLNGVISEMEKKGAVPLIPLPTSPDSRSRLHELEDAVAAFGLEAGDMAKIMEKLKEEYVYDRKDITPESM
jgi:hypothetical protein